ncbi:MAG: 3-phosphoshikimate 1-carboxyvinyltransferase, partial [Persicimonas sp.]
VVAHLHPSRIEVEGDSHADDVWYMKEALARLDGTGDDEPVTIRAGEGGTTLRFLLAVAATRPAVTQILAAPGVLDRPHALLVEALEEGGAKITPLDDERGRGFEVVGWDEMPASFTVAADRSSQYASALALLAATGKEFELELSTPMVSRPYFEMTLAMLRSAGVDVDRDGATVSFRAGASFDDARRLVAAPDASSAAVWRVADFLGLDVSVDGAAEASLQPDAMVDEVLDALGDAPGVAPVELDLGASPDLVPVVAVAASQMPASVEITGVAHLRHKESNRIEQLAEAFGAVGIDLEATDDGLVIPTGKQRPAAGARFPSFGDHRLAMAGLLLAAVDGPLVLDDPWVVAKSYPDLWHDARSVGYMITTGGSSSHI